ncbi:MAG: PAS domain S-box protein [Aquabacterium sp.]|jgi:PAS domain S-box-containing protein|nr:MAG: PAS domain S-box protein [Aquabacterium sp.]
MPEGIPPGTGAPQSAAPDLQTLQDELARIRLREERYRASFELCPSCQAIAALDGRLLDVNPRACELLGYTREELLKLRFHDITHPDDLASDLGHAADLLAGRIERYRIEKRYLHRDGHAIWCELSVALSRAPDGRPAEMVGVFDDITERKRVEAELISRDELLAGVSRHTPGALLVVHMSADGQKRCAPYASEGLRELYELDPQDVRHDTSPLAARVHPEDLPRLAEVYQRSAVTLKSIDMEHRVILPARGQRWIRMHSAPQRGADGSTTWYGYSTDITERKQIEARIVESEAWLSGLSRNLPGMFFVFRPEPIPDGHFEYVSEGVQELFGLTPEEATGDIRRLYARINRDDVAAHAQVRDTAVAQKGRLHFEARADVPGKGLRWYSIDSVAEMDAQGQQVRYGYIADITERKLYADAKVAAETAQRASQAKSEFLSRMSHELRTPLNAVIGFAQLLKMDAHTPLGDEQLGRVGMIERAGAHLLAVIGDVLDLSRIEAGSLPLSMEPLQLAQVVDDARIMTDEAARRAHVRLVPPAVDPALHVHADRIRLRQVLVNLLSNAVKYNRHGGEVRVQAQREGGEITISVTDTGLGLSTEQIEHLFEPFNRLGAEDTGIEGTGIGLVIVRRLVELMKGRISVSSQHKVGTVFTLKLPASEEPAPAPAPSSQTTTPESSKTMRTATVLYAEDNDVNVLLVRQILELRPAWKLVVANSGEQALQTVRNERPDLLLLDMHLGDMTGFELAEELDKDPATSGIVRVALSADAMPDRIHAARARGFAAYLTKPLDVMALLRCLDEQLANG